MSELENNQIDEKIELEDQIEEETAAASSLHPAARSVSDPKSRIQMMTSVLQGMDSMPKKDLVKWFDQTMSQFGPNKDYGVGNKSDSNKSSINMKPSAAGSKGADRKDAMPKINVKEDVEEMFVGSELSEEFKDKASTLFEAAINARLTLETARLEEEFQVKIEEEIKSVHEELVGNLDTYLDYVVEQWMSENEVAIESTLRNEIINDFIESMKGVFAEHYIEMPNEKVDVVESLADKVEALEGKLNDVISENVELKRNLVENEKKEVFENLKSGLALTQQEKFKALAEGIEFDGNLETYTKKLNVIKETYFKQEKVESNIITESFEEPVAQVVNTDPSVNRYVTAISRTVKK